MNILHVYYAIKYKSDQGQGIGRHLVFKDVKWDSGKTDLFYNTNESYT